MFYKIYILYKMLINNFHKLKVFKSVCVCLRISRSPSLTFRQTMVHFIQYRLLQIILNRKITAQQNS